MSALPDAQGALLDLLRARLPDTQVEWSHPGPSIKHEAVFYGQAEEDERAVALGNRRRDEDWKQTVYVSVEKPGNDPRGTSDRCMELVQGVEDVLRDNPDLGGTCLSAQVAGKRLNYYPGQRAYTAEATVTVSISTRI